MGTIKIDRSQQQHVCCLCEKRFKKADACDSLGKHHPDDTDLCMESQCLCSFCCSLSEAAMMCVRIADAVGCTPETVATLMAPMNWKNQLANPHMDLVPYDERPLTRAMSDCTGEPVTPTARLYYKYLPDHRQSN